MLPVKKRKLGIVFRFNRSSQLNKGDVQIGNTDRCTEADGTCRQGEYIGGEESLDKYAGRGNRQ